MGFSRKEYWSGLPFPSPVDLPDPGIEPRSLILQADAGRHFNLWATRKGSFKYSQVWELEREGVQERELCLLLHFLLGLRFYKRRGPHPHWYHSLAGKISMYTLSHFYPQACAYMYSTRWHYFPSFFFNWNFYWDNFRLLRSEDNTWLWEIIQRDLMYPLPGFPKGNILQYYSTISQLVYRLWNNPLIILSLPKFYLYSFVCVCVCVCIECVFGFIQLYHLCWVVIWHHS